MSDSAKFDSRYEASDASQFGFTRDEFKEMLERQIARAFPNGVSGNDRQKFFDALHLDDLILARACARGNEKAWDRFLSLYRAKLYMAAAAIARDETTGRELADSIYGDLFGLRAARDGSRVSKLNLYGGRGSLEGWLKTLLAQEFVNRYRSGRKLVNFDERLEMAAGGDLESQVLPTEHVKLERATDQALAALSAEEQFILAAYHLDGRTLAEIAHMLGVHESTVSRRLEKTAAALRKRIIKELCREGLSKPAAEATLKIDVRDLGIDVRARLAEQRRSGTF